ncbi:uncharacterized protein TM35_000292590 [Trypanosoma theileri]|uniref:Uncharacterized protein n=1 Tax=Trypanosoma theileri TaxID=67003 RepID=A0A1X0NNV6_9TRYP|nr:uncharacterized protein TM35_000292590 [Trypanosoma theileri]ORC86377.1 hypothetical protein TM35_000292590 [Trypanosoma theileri]
MSWWCSLSKQLLLQVRKHPAVENYARQGVNYVWNHPSRKKAATTFSNSWEEMRRRMESSIPVSKQSGFKKTKDSPGYTAYIINMWNMYKGRVFSFIAVNFMGIIFFFQFGSALWPMAKQMVAGFFDRKEIKIARDDNPVRTIKTRPVNTENPERADKQSGSHHEDEYEGKVKSLKESPFNFLDSSDEHVQKSMKQMERNMFGNMEKVDFSTSFKFRMSEDEEFRSSVGSNVINGSSP